MTSVAEAEKIILEHLFSPSRERIPIGTVCGRVLASEVKADRDLPPFDRATMDGIAIEFGSLKTNTQSFRIEGLQAAGQPRQTLSDSAGCIEITTGAPLPLGTNSVVPYEHIIIEKDQARVIETVTKNQNVHRRASDATKGEVLLTPGFKISPAEVALLASVGYSEVEAFKFPSVAIISTGDELVDVDQTPLPHQIRKSNSYALAAALETLNCDASVFHLADDEKVITEAIKKVLDEHELIILSGGVSKGKLDFVPKVLESLGVKKLFHQVSQRPGKPMWFGQSDRNTVFALPGNPVSTFMCFHRYVKPWLMRSLGLEFKHDRAILAEDFTFEPALTYFLQVKVQNSEGKLMAFPKAGGGSGDFANLKDVDGFLELPRERSDFKKGEVFKYFEFRNRV